MLIVSSLGNPSSLIIYLRDDLLDDLGKLIMKILKAVQKLFSNQSFEEMPVEQVLQQFKLDFEKKHKRVKRERKAVSKSLVFQKKEFLILLDKAQFDKQLRELLPYAVKLKKDGQYVDEGKRLMDACKQMLQEINAFCEAQPEVLTIMHHELLQENTHYQKLFDKAQRYAKLTKQHEKQLYGDEKLIKKDLVRRATEMLESHPANDQSEEAFMIQKKQWIQNEVNEILQSVRETDKENPSPSV